MRAPVWTTIAVAEPETTFVPMKRRLRCSSGASLAVRRSANFSSGSDSPVRAACAMKRSRAPSTRQSAGIMSPAERTTTSPGTRRLIGISRRTWRSTVALLLTIAFSASAARVERCSWTKRIAVLRSTITPITKAALASWVAYDTAASAVSSRLKGSL